MAGAWTILAILDGGGTSRNMRVWDESGAGTGPFSFAHLASTETGTGSIPALDSSLSTINTTLNAPMQNSGGSVTANAGTNLNTSALSTSNNQTNASQKTQIVDGSGNVIASTSNALDVNVSSGTVATTQPSNTDATVTATIYSSLTSATKISATVAGTLGVAVFNGTNAALYIGLGANNTSPTIATFSEVSVVIQPNGYYECPFNFTGAVYAIQSGATSGYATVSQFTAT